MSEMVDCARPEAILDDEAVAKQIAQLEARLPIGARPRQLRLRSLLLGMLSCAAEHRPAHLSRVHESLRGLREADKSRLGVIASWHGRAHELTYRQVEYTNDLLCALLAKDHLDGGPSRLLSRLCDALVEASIAGDHKAASSSLAIDWSDLESFSNPPPAKGGCADPEASWGHRKGGGAGEKSELFFGYYFSLATMVHDEHQSAVPELVRQMTLTSCHLDPVPAQVASLEALTASGVVIGDVLADAPCG